MFLIKYYVYLWGFKSRFYSIITFSNINENNQPSTKVLLTKDSGFDQVAPYLQEP